MTRMRRCIPCLLALAVLVTGQAAAGQVTASRNIRAGEVISLPDLIGENGVAPEAGTADDLVGFAAIRTIFRGQEIGPADLGPPTVVGRNDIVAIVFSNAVMMLRAEGRALDEGAVGSRIRVLNLDSRIVVVGTVLGDRTVEVNR